MARTAARTGVPLKAIFDANPRAIRDDLGDLTELSASMDAEGLKVPLLLTPDFRIIDGARRLQAAYELGWTDVWAVATDTWATVADIFSKALAFEKKGYPFLKMRWMETFQQREIIKESYALGPGKRAPKGQGQKQESGSRKIEMAMDPLMREAVSTINAIQTMARYLEAIRLQRPEKLSEAMSYMDEVEKSGQGAWSHGRLRTILSGIGEYEPAPSDAKMAKEHIRIFTSGIEVLEVTYAELDRVGSLNAAISPKEARDLYNKLRRATVVAYRLRNRLKYLAYGEREERENDDNQD